MVEAFVILIEMLFFILILMGIILTPWRIDQWMGLFKLLDPTKDDNYEFRSAVLSHYIYIGIGMDGVI